MMRQVQNDSTVVLLLTIFLIGLISACRLSKRVLARGSMFEGAETQNATAAFKERIGGPFKALSVEIEKDWIKLRAQDPKKPAHVDEYRYAASIVAGPTPVELNSLENNLTTTLFEFDSVNWGATESLARQAVEQTNLEGGKVTRMSIERGISFGSDVTKSGPVKWLVQVKGTRESATAFADVQGQILGLDLSQTSRAAQFTMFSADSLREAVSRINYSFGGNVKLIECSSTTNSCRSRRLTPRARKSVSTNTTLTA